MSHRHSIVPKYILIHQNPKNPLKCASTNGQPIEILAKKFTRATRHQAQIQNRKTAQGAEGKYALVLRVGLEGVERRLLVNDGVVHEREAAGSGPRVGLLLPLRQLVPRLRAPPSPAAGVLPGRLPQKEGALLLPAALAAVRRALGARYARLIHRRGGGGRGFALLRHQIVWRLEAKWKGLGTGGPRLFG